MKRIYYIIAAILFSLLNSNAIYAQFYDDDDEIYFYQRVNGNDNDSKVFNFDGKKATNFDNPTTLKIKDYLGGDINYFEKKVYEVDYDIKYRDDLSSSSWTVYYKYQSSYNFYGVTFPSTTEYFYFSKDRKTLVMKEGDGREFNYRLVDKDYYIDGGRRRSNTNNGVIYE